MVEHLNLNNDWRYSTTFCNQMIDPSYDDSSMELVRLPHTNVVTPYHYFDEKIYQFVSCYRKHIFAKSEWKGKQVLITFEAVGHVAKVYLNNALINTHEGGYTAFTIDLSPYLNQGEENIIIVEVDSRESNNLPPFGNVIDYLTYGGIYREVSLEIKNQVYIKDAYILSKEIEGVNANHNRITTDVITEDVIAEDVIAEDVVTEDVVTEDVVTENVVTENVITENVITENVVTENAGSTNVYEKTKLKFLDDLTTKEVELWVTIQGLKEELLHELQLHYSILDFSGKVVYQNTAPISQQTVKLHFTVDGVKNWDLDNPHLYNLKLELIELNSALISIDEKTVRFGFRTCEFREDGFYLNHKKIKLLGLNRHQSFPYVGYAMPKRMQQRDAELLKYELQVNAVRTSHYPQSKHFINRCDELGLLVFTEIPGWQHIGDEEWKEKSISHVREMILQYRNHPSIILWGVRINESQDDDAFYSRTNQVAHELDPVRQTGGVRYLQKSKLLEDVYTYNDFLHSGRNKGLSPKKAVTSLQSAPYLVSEYNGHMYPTKTFDDESHRLQHALRHACVLDALFEQKDIAGGFGWCMFDYNTHKDFGSGDRICYHGVMDMFRNPKLAASVYSSQGEEVQICELSTSLDIGDHPAGNIKKVYAFTNADSIRLYKNNTFIKDFYPLQKPYGHLPHPPILIDDFVGELLEKEEHYSHKTSETMKKILYAVKEYGPNNLPLKYKLRMAGLMLKEHLKLEDGTRLYYKYIGSWGGQATSFRLEAIKNGKVTKAITKTPANNPKLVISVDTSSLKEEETYDVSAIRIKAVDEWGNTLPYYQEPIKLEAWGSIELIGPSVISLKGGMAGAYVRTKGISGEGKLRISQSELGEYYVKYQVQILENL